MHTIYVTNMADHDQKFEVHGWNNNNNLTVNPGTTAAIEAEDGTSGAIIALHDGHEGEQAEITKNGWGGNYNSHHPLEALTLTTHSERQRFH